MQTETNNKPCSVEEIHSVGTINNVETSYFTQLKKGLPNDNVSMSVGHLDHVLIVYSWIEHVTWKSPVPMFGWVGRILHSDSKVVDREAQRQTRWIKEALWIRKTPKCMNRDAGSYQLSHTWDQVISVGCVAQLVERRSLTGELSLSRARPAADG